MGYREIKEFFRRTREDRWDYKLLVETGTKVSQKACGYWWVCVPEALFKWMAMYIILGIFLSVAFFIGFSTEGSRLGFHKWRRARSGRWKIVTPLEFSLAVLLVWIVYIVGQWVSAHAESIVYWARMSMYAITGMAAVIAIIYAARHRIERGWYKVELRAKRTWNRICPDLIIEPATREGAQEPE